MPRYVALLRAINVGGHVVKMADLRTAFESLGFKEVETFIASGNVIFTSTSKAAGALEGRIAAELERVLGFEVATFLRTDSEIAAIARCRPFPAARIEASSTFCVGFLAAPLAAPGVKTLGGLGTEKDEFHVHGREVYWISKLRQSESKFTNVVFERAVKVRSTFRGMNTVTKLAARYPPAVPAAKRARR